MISSGTDPQPSFRVPNFCPECGDWVVNTNQEFTRWECSNRHKTYCNPVPVAVGILVTEDLGVVQVRRNLRDGFGKLAFPGGNIGSNETDREATSREVFEETGFKCDPDLWEPDWFHSATGNERILLFSRYQGRVPANFDWIPDGREVSAIEVVYNVPHKDKLAFPLHEFVLNKVLRSL